MKRVSSIFLFIFFCITATWAGENKNMAIWEKIAKGKELFYAKDYGEALSVFRACLAVENISEYSLPLTLYIVNYDEIVERIEKKIDKEYFKNCYIKSTRKNYYVLYKGIKLEEKINLSNILKDIKYVPRIPEAYYWMGRIYEIESEFELAEINYKKAIEQSMSLEIMDFLFEVYYRLIDVYIKTENRVAFLNTIDTLLGFDPLFSDKTGKKNLEDYLICFNRLGLDKTLELYRLADDKFISAYYKYANYYVNNGNFEEAKKYLFLNVFTVCSIILENLNISEYNFKYENIEKTLEKAVKEKYILDFIVNSNLFKNFYELGVLYKNMGDNVKARYFFWLAIRFDTGQWKNLSNQEWISLQ